MFLLNLKNTEGDTEWTRAGLVEKLVPYYIPYKKWNMNFTNNFLAPLLKHEYITVRKSNINVVVTIDMLDNSWVYHLDREIYDSKVQALRTRASREALLKKVGELDVDDAVELLGLRKLQVLQDLHRLRIELQLGDMSDGQIIGIVHYALRRANSAFVKKILRK